MVYVHGKWHKQTAPKGRTVKYRREIEDLIVRTRAEIEQELCLLAIEEGFEEKIRWHLQPNGRLREKLSPRNESIALAALTAAKLASEKGFK